MGKVSYELSEKVKKSKVFARSLFVVKDMNAGGKLTEDNIRSIRPGYGMHPKYFKEIIGKKIRKDVKKGTPLSWDLIKQNG